MSERAEWKYDLVAIKERPRAGKLSQGDIETLESIVVSAEKSIEALRAAVVE